MPQTVNPNRLKNCRYGTMLYNVNDMYIGRSFDLYGEFSEGEVALFRQIVRPKDIVLDIGANIGAHTIFFARATSPGGIVIAYEPQRVIHQMLCANVALNGLINVYCNQVAVGERAGSVKVPVLNPYVQNNLGALALGSHTTGDDVQVIALDSLSLPRCRLIKIDVEGMELAVLKGGINLIQRHRPILYVENDREDRSAALIKFIDSIGYQMHGHLPPLFNPNNFFKHAENVFGKTVSKNVLCVPKGSNVHVSDLPAVEPKKKSESQSLPTIQ